MRPSIPHIPFIERDAVALQKHAVFLLERFATVMFLLPGDVIANGWHGGFADRKRPVTRLPRKFAKFIPLCFDPFRRGFFDVFDRLADGHCAGKFKKDVNVVFDGIDKYWRASQVLQYGGHVGV